MVRKHEEADISLDPLEEEIPLGSNGGDDGGKFRVETSAMDPRKHLRIVIDRRISAVWTRMDLARQVAGEASAGIVVSLYEEYCWLREFREELAYLGLL